MNILLDACSVINLINGDMLSKIVSSQKHKYYIGEMLLDQEILNSSQQEVLEILIKDNLISIIESNITISEFNKIKEKFDLGMGETECIALCKKFGYSICTDDKKARKCSKLELGESNVVGSLFLLKEVVEENLIVCTEAKLSYKFMKLKGGFLPNIEVEFFCNI